MTWASGRNATICITVVRTAAGIAVSKVIRRGEGEMASGDDDLCELHCRFRAAGQVGHAHSAGYVAGPNGPHVLGCELVLGVMLPVGRPIIAAERPKRKRWVFVQQGRTSKFVSPPWTMRNRHCHPLLRFAGRCRRKQNCIHRHLQQPFQ